MGFAYMASVVAAWFFIFHTMRVHATWKIPLSSEMLDFFRNNSLVNIYYGLAVGIKDNREKNIKITDKKAEALSKGYKAMILSLIILMIFTFFYGAYMWTTKLSHN